MKGLCAQIAMSKGLIVHVADFDCAKRTTLVILALTPV